MRIVTACAAALLLLAGCGTSEEPDEGESGTLSASASPTAQAEEPDLEAVCDALGETVVLPGGDAVEYIVDFNEPTGWATNAPVCDIEPKGEYYDVAAEAAEFGRAEFNYGVLTEEQLPNHSFPEYDPDAVEELLTLDEAEPLTADQVPCADEPCENGVHGYFYSFRFETLRADVAVIAQIDYLTDDVGGGLQAEYRSQAIAAFTASMDVIAAELQ